MRQRLLTLIAVAASGFALAGGVAQAGDSTAVAINTKDDSSLVRIVFNITKVVAGHDVDASNAAAAVASCDSCDTLAVAFQIVLASGSPDVVIPENLAIAMNVDCNLCETLADAYQWVYAGDVRMTFTKDGMDRIKAIKKELNDLEHSGLPVDQIQARVVELAGEVQQILNTELVAVDNPSANAGDSAQGSPPDTGTSTAPADTGSSTTPTDTGTSTTPTDTTTTETGTQTQPTDTGTGTSTTPTDTGTDTTTTNTGTSTSPTG